MPTTLYIDATNPKKPPLLTVADFEDKCALEGLDPKKVVFIFPGNSSHHAQGTTLFTIKSGGGLAALAAAIGKKGYPTLSLPTTSMEEWSTSISQQKCVQRAINDLHDAVRQGYTLMLPIRPQQNHTYFSRSISGIENYEPCFWGENQRTPNLSLADHYLNAWDTLINTVKSATTPSVPNATGSQQSGTKSTQHTSPPVPKATGAQQSGTKSTQHTSYSFLMAFMAHPVVRGVLLVAVIAGCVAAAIAVGALTGLTNYAAVAVTTAALLNTTPAGLGIAGGVVAAASGLLSVGGYFAAQKKTTDEKPEAHPKSPKPSGHR